MDQAARRCRTAEGERDRTIFWHIWTGGSGYHGRSRNSNHIQVDGDSPASGRWLWMASSELHLSQQGQTGGIESRALHFLFPFVTISRELLRTRTRRTLSVSYASPFIPRPKPWYHGAILPPLTDDLATLSSSRFASARSPDVVRRHSIHHRPLSSTYTHIPASSHPNLHRSHPQAGALKHELIL